MRSRWSSPRSIVRDASIYLAEPSSRRAKFPRAKSLRTRKSADSALVHHVEKTAAGTASAVVVAVAGVVSMVGARPVGVVTGVEKRRLDLLPESVMPVLHVGLKIVRDHRERATTDRHDRNARATIDRLVIKATVLSAKNVRDHLEKANPVRLVRVMDGHRAKARAPVVPPLIPSVVLRRAGRGGKLV
jgi:hypothetical protein